MDTTALNPFVAGGAIGDPGGQGFFGRAKIFGFVRSALNSVQRSPVLLIGQRRIGKSSVLRQLPNHLPPDYCCIYFDLQGKDQMSLDDVLYGLARAISDGVKMDRPGRAQATEPNFQQFLDAAFAKLNSHPERLVLLFDEFDVVDVPPGAAKDIAVNRFIPYLSELIARDPKLGCVLVVGRKTEELSGSLNSILLKDSVQCAIGRLDPGEVRDLISKSTAGTLQFDEAAIQRIVELAAGHPYCTQVLCHVIWDRAIQEPSLRPVSAADVDRSIPGALELGANGMNWIFDGLTDPVHRLVLAAIAQPMDMAQPVSVGRAEIDAALRKRSARLEAPEIDRAVRDLRSWDIITESGVGFLITVPMIGLWIKDRRPLERLEREVRFANPRAWKFYELALDSRERGDLDEAIEELRLAIRANPSFAEAQRALGSALLQRARLEEIGETIENLERAFDLDPTGPKTELLEALSLGITSTSSIEVIKNRFERIRELDPGGSYEQRAQRTLTERAQLLHDSNESSDASKAAILFDLLGNSVAAAAARATAKGSSPLFVLGWLLSFAAVWAVGYVPVPVLVPWLKLLAATLGGAFLAISTHQDKREGLGRTRMILLALLVFGAIGWTFKQPSNLPAYVLAFFFFVVVVNATPIAVKLGPFPEDEAQRVSNSPFARIRKATRILFEGTPFNRPEKK